MTTIVSKKSNGSFKCISMESDTEEEKEDDEIFSSLTAKNTGYEKWDIPPFYFSANEGDPSQEMQKMRLTMKIVKILISIFTFTIVLSSSIISKVSLLFMTSQISQNNVLEICEKGLGRSTRYSDTADKVALVRWSWCIIITYTFPEVCYFLRSVRICIFKKSSKPILKDFIIIGTLEALNAVGHSLLLFSVLPNLDVVCGAMITTCVFLIPGVLGLHSPYNETREEELNSNISGNIKESDNIKKSRAISIKNSFLLSFDVLAILSQISGLLVWPIVYGGRTKQLLVIPLAFIFVSAGWWENNASHCSYYSIIRCISDAKGRINKSRYFIYAFLSAWKIIVFLCTSFLFWYFNGDDISEYFNRIPEIFSGHKIMFSEYNMEKISLAEHENNSLNTSNNEKTIQQVTSDHIFIYCLLIQLSSGYICYMLGKFACKVSLQIFSFSFPLTLTVPMTVTLLILICKKHSENPCYFDGILSNYQFFKSPSSYDLNNFMHSQQAWLWVPWIISQIWIMRHIWTPKFHRVATTEDIFVNSSYSGALVDQSIIASRRRSDEPPEKNKDSVDQSHDDVNLSIKSMGNKLSTCVTQIYVCATLWHETGDEMKNLLKSIFYLDSDQSARETAQEYFKVKDPNYYKLEVNIYFDDAFDLDHDEQEVVNEFVKIFVSTISVAASEVHEQEVKLKSPIMYSMPYGGRLVWILPGKNKMIVHLKNRKLIKMKKRWSLVMNFYYILGYKLLCCNIDSELKEKQAKNTYILALDGDVSFKPEAVQMLIDCMKKNPRVGAVCGRIHPLGSGPMVWYQIFEYAISHWFQKAAENVIGSVLCSTGCFSLYRSEALFLVANEFTTRPTEAMHYYQFEQGEDRWLSTLLLQHGFLIEYCAASDAHTHVPETFYEFYNQRRRWIPSTIINTMDLIAKFKSIPNIYTNISSLYIGYQMIVIAGNLLGPGVVLLLLTAAFHLAFGFDVWISFIFNFTPIALFVLICMISRVKTQKGAALLLSTVYGLVMMPILAVILTEIFTSGPFAPISFFGCALLGGFILATSLHPMEYRCMIHGILFYLGLPSVYLFLVIYAVFSLDGASWGTREIFPNFRLKKEPRKRKNSFSTLNSENKEEMGTLQCSLPGIFKCIFCPDNNDIREEKKFQIEVSEKLASIENYLKKLERGPISEGTLDRKEPIDPPNNIEKIVEIGQNSDLSSSLESVEEIEKYSMKPFWTTEFLSFDAAKYSPVEPSENEFWESLIHKYIYPQSPTYMKFKMIDELRNFRNKCAYAFIMLNAIFIATILTLQSYQEPLSINWPLGTRITMKFSQETRTFQITKNYYKLDPLGLTLILFFSTLLIQLICMCIHRMRTFCHILSSTQLKEQKKGPETTQITPDFALEITREWQKLRGIDSDLTDGLRVRKGEIVQNTEGADLNYNSLALLEISRKVRFEDIPKHSKKRNSSGKRGTIMVIESDRNKKRVNSHDLAFKQRIESINPTHLNGTVFGKRPSGRNSSLGIVQDIIIEETKC